MFIKKGFLDRLGFFISHGLFIGKGLTPSEGGVNLSGWYQWIFTGDENEIVALDSGGYGYKNYGSGDIEQPILNTQIATLLDTNKLTFTDLTGVGIEEYRGESYYKNQQIVLTVVANTSFTIQINNEIHTFLYTDDTPTNKLFWAYSGMSIDGITFIDNGDNVGVYKTSGSADFSGGWHGNEIMTSNELLLDGVEIDLTVSNTYYGQNIRYSENSNILQFDNAAINESYREKYFDFTFTGNEIKTNVKTTFLTAPLTSVYYANQLTVDTFYDHLQVIGGSNYDLRVEAMPLQDIKPIQYQSFGGKTLNITQATTTSKQAFQMFSGLSSNKKIYYGYSGSIQWNIGDIVESNTIANYENSNVRDSKFSLSFTVGQFLRVGRRFTELDMLDYNMGVTFKAQSGHGVIYLGSEYDVTGGGVWLRLDASNTINVRALGSPGENYTSPLVTDNEWTTIEVDNQGVYFKENFVHIMNALGGLYGSNSAGFNVLNYTLDSGAVPIEIRELIYRGERFYCNEGDGNYLVGERGSIISLKGSPTWQAEPTKPDALPFKGYYNRVDNAGDAVPRLRGNDIEFTQGIQGYLKLTDGNAYYWQEGSGLRVFSIQGSVAALDDQTGVWDTKSNIVFPALLKYGYTLFLKDGTTDEYLRVIYVNGEPQSSSEVEYTYQYEVPPNAGFSNTGNTVNWVNGDVGLQAVADQYSIPYILSFDQMLAIDFSVIPEGVLRVTFEDNVFKDWAVQPYESVTYEGEVVTHNGEPITYLKDELL